MNRHDSVSIIVPMLNEAASLEELYLRTRNALQGLRSFEFIAVDDGSADDTIDVLKRLRGRYPNICVLSHYRNHGKSLALMQGFSAARGAAAVVMDADLQDQPEMIPRLLEKLEEGYDLVNGWRSARQDPFAKRFVSGVFNALTSRILKCPLHDINCGMKAMRRHVYQRLELRGDLHRLIPAIAATQGFKVTEVPVVHAPRKFGKSKYRLLRHRGLLDIIALIAGSTTQLRPFHIFSEMGFLFWLAAFAALLSWAALTAWLPMNSLAFHLARPLVGLLGVGAAFLGIVLPLLGFHLDLTTSRLQDGRWRDSLLREQLARGRKIMDSASLQKDFHKNADAHRFWNRMGNPFLLARERRLAELLAGYLAPGACRLLEVGCGEGSNLLYLRDRLPGVRLVGMDFSFEKVRFLREICPSSEAVCGDATRLPFGDAVFDMVLFRDLLHHVNWARETVLQEGLRVTKPDGVAIVMESNGRTLLNRIFRLVHPAERGMADSTRAKLLALGGRVGRPTIRHLEVSLLVRAIGYLVGWRNDARRWLLRPLYTVALAWERLLERLLPKHRWAYLMMSLKRG